MQSATDSWFDEPYWLPRNVSWRDMPPDPRDLLYSLHGAIPFVLLRVIWEAFVGIPLGHLLGYCEGSVWANAKQHFFGGFARNTRQKRILETFWRFSFYLVAWIYGIIVLWNKDWLWDVKACWINYPYHHVDTSIWFYYMVETSFYYSLIFGAVFDVRRSDFWQLMIHHVVTIGLLSVSYAINFIRVGTLVLVSHDIADIFLEGGKLVRYAGDCATATNVMFVFFLLSWIVTRLGYYPLVVIRSAIFEAAPLIQPDYLIYDPFQIPYVPRLIILLLAALFVLHIFWTYVIGKIVIRTITVGEAADVRSDEEDEEEEQELRERQRAKRLTKKKE